MKHLQLLILLGTVALLNSCQSTGESGPTTIPVPLVQQMPVYPPQLRKNGVQGKAVVAFIVTTRGDVAEAHVINDCDPQLAQVAIAAVLKWKFTPGMKNGRLMNSIMQVPIDFRFADESGPPSAAGAPTAPATPPGSAPTKPAAGGSPSPPATEPAGSGENASGTRNSP